MLNMWYIFPLPLTPPLFPFVLSANLSRLLFNEYFERVVDVCYDYVLDSSAVGRDWLDELAAVDVTLRSHVRSWLLLECVKFW